MRRAHTVFVLCRISNLPTVLGNVLAAWFLSGGAWDLRLIPSFASGALCYLGGMILNDVHDVDWDRRHGKRRPIPDGRISRQAAAWLGWACLTLGWAGLLLLGANLFWATGLAAAIVSYNALHKRWAGSAWLMASCRFFLFIAVASIPAVSLPLPVWLWAAALTSYVAGISFAARGEDMGWKWKRHSLAYLLLPAFFALYFVPRSACGHTWPIFVLGCFVLWVLWAHRQAHRGEISAGAFVGRLLAGMVLVDAMAVSTASIQATVLCLLLLPLNLRLQTAIPAT